MSVDPNTSLTYSVVDRTPPHTTVHIKVMYNGKPVEETQVLVPNEKYTVTGRTPFFQEKTVITRRKIIRRSYFPGNTTYKPFVEIEEDRLLEPVISYSPTKIVLIHIPSKTRVKILEEDRTVYEKIYLKKLDTPEHIPIENIHGKITVIVQTPLRTYMETYYKTTRTINVVKWDKPYEHVDTQHGYIQVSTPGNKQTKQPIIIINQDGTKTVYTKPGSLIITPTRIIPVPVTGHITIPQNTEIIEIIETEH
jgi:hypothetical protein